MAYIPTNAGWGAAATKKKTPPPTASKPKPPKSYDPYGALAGASPQQLSEFLFRTQMQGPDYSSVTPPDFNQLQTAALTQAQQSAYRQATPVQDERGYQQARQKVSAEAATNFAKAFSDILTGGKPGAEGEAFSLQNFGGSYLAGMAAQMGQQLISQQQHSFDEQDFKLASRLADIMDAVPEQADKIYQGLADQAVELFKQNKSIADADFKTQIEAIASLIKNKRDDAKGVGGTGKPVVRNFSDGTSRQYNPQTGKWDVVTTKAGGGVDVSTVTQPGGAVVGYDKNTGKVIYTIPGSGKTATGGSGTINGTATGKPISFSAASEYARSMTSNTGTLWKVRKVKGGGYEAYDTGQTKAGSGGSSGSGPKLTASQRMRATAAASKIADVTFHGDPDKGLPALSYQDALVEMQKEGIPLAIAQQALNRFWRQGAPGMKVVRTGGPEKGFIYGPNEVDENGNPIPGKGRPLVPFQERNRGKGKAARVAANQGNPDVQGSQFANYTGPAPDDSVIYAQYKNSRPLPDAQLVAILRQAGFEGRGLQLAYSIAKRESGGNPLAFNPDVSTGDRSWGLFQINTLGSMADRIKQFGLQSEMQLLDPLANARAAYRMTNGGKNWYHWGVDTGYGAYRNAPVTMLPLPAGNRA